MMHSEHLLFSSTWRATSLNMQWPFGGCSQVGCFPCGIAVFPEVDEQTGMLAAGHPAVPLMYSILLVQLFEVFSGQLHL